MDRRNFLSTFFGTAAGLVMSKELGADLLPWKESTLVLPPAEPALLTAQVIMREFMERLDAHLTENLPIRRTEPESELGTLECQQSGCDILLALDHLKMSLPEFSDRFLNNAALNLSFILYKRAKKENAAALHGREMTLPHGPDMAVRATGRGLSIRMISEVPSGWPFGTRLLRFDTAYSFTPDILPA